MKNIFWFIVGGVLSIFIMWLLPQSHQKIHYINQQDTITIIDTFTQYLPKPIEVIKWRDTTIYVNDTTYVVLPFEKKRYTNENYDLIISGYKPTLESVTVYPETKYIYQQTTINEKKKVTFNHGIQGGFGYGLINKKLDVYLGYGFQFSF